MGVQAVTFALWWRLRVQRNAMSSAYKRLITVGLRLHLTPQHTDVDTFQTSRLLTSLSISRTCTWTLGNRDEWLPGTDERQQWPAKQPSCHIYLRLRPNLSRRSAPFIPSGSSDRITTAGRSAWRHGIAALSSLSLSRSVCTLHCRRVLALNTLSVT